MLGRPLRLVWLLVAAFALVAGAAVRAQTPQATAANAVSATPAVPVADGGSYRIARGDELHFRFTYTPELNIQAVVRPDGRVALPMVGEMRVEGLSIRELTDQVEQALAGQVRRPQVVINLHGTGSQRVFVGGEVTRPGMQPLVGPLTVLQAVMAAEGLKEGAQPAQVLLLRRGADGQAQPQRVDLARLMAGEPDARDVPLQPFDVVLVPRSGIANFNLWVDQYIRRALPLSLGFSYTINRNGSLQ